MGFFHVHTDVSHDGYGTLAEAASAARKLGARFLILTEHNILSPAQPHVVEEVLVVPGVEISANAGHVAAVGLERLPEERGPGILAAIEEAGGAAILAHPVNLRRPWDDPSTEGFVGFEALSLESSFREAMAGRPLRIAQALLTLPVDRRKVGAFLMERPDDALRRYDEIAATRDLTMMCGVDAHGLPPYLSSFGALALHLSIPANAFGGDPGEDAARVVEAIRKGQTFCSVPALGDASSFSLREEGGRVIVEVDTAEATIVLFHEGVAAARGQGPRLEAAAAPGPWRAEVFLDPGFPWGRERLWIASSSMRLPLTTLPEGS